MNSYLTKDQILAAQDRQYKEVEVKEWGGFVRLQSLDADAALQQEAIGKKREKGDATANPLTSMLAASIVDAQGNTLFTEKDVAALGKKSPAVLVRLINEVKELNKLGDAEEGNSGASQGVGSPSSSASP